MGKSLVIVESPAKAKTINKYLGNQYVVKSSIGHIRDLPTSGSAATKEPVKRGKTAAEGVVLSPKEKAKRQLFARMGVDPEHGWKAKYEILPGKEKVIEELRRLAKDADTIYLATDLDREGEAIAWHLREAIGGDDSRYKRVVFNEITKKAIQEAFSKPGELDINRVNAQQARRFLDRVVGYMVSPLLWAKIARGLSAGRVQSVAVKLVVEREKEIRAFVPEEYWEVHADLGTAKNAKVRFEVVREGGAAFKPVNEAQAMAALEKLKASSYSIVKREDKPTSSKPSAPFITSTLQQEAARKLGVYVESVCGGRATCGRCQIEVQEGNFAKHKIVSSLDHISEKGPKEERYEKIRGLPEGRRLSCSALILGDLVVDVPQDTVINAQVVRKAATDPAMVENLKTRYPVISCRAFASLVDFTTWSRKALAEGGIWFAMKGKHPDEEIAALPADVNVFHVEPLAVPGLDAERCVIWLKLAS